MSEKTRPSSLSASPETSRPQTKSRSRRGARAATAVAVALMMALSAGTADARAGKSSSAGSRGSRTHEAPAATSTTPGSASTMDRTAAPQTAPRPGASAAAPAAQPSRFGGGFMGGIMGGLIGAGIGAMLFGGGFFEGLGSFAGILGFILQILLVVFLVRLAMRFFRSRSQNQGTPAMGRAMGGGNPAYAGGPQTMNRDAADGRSNPLAGGLAGLGGGMGGGMGGGSAGPAPRRQAADELGIQPGDYQAFEQLLVTVQTAYGREDLDGLRAATTPEMFRYFNEDLADNQHKGIINKISDVRLLQGDLAEAWREGAQEFATVAMRFSLVDVTVDRVTGNTVKGDANRAEEATELWTFVRPRGGQWQLSAIQQAN